MRRKIDGPSDRLGLDTGPLMGDLIGDAFLEEFGVSMTAGADHPPITLEALEETRKRFETVLGIERLKQAMLEKFAVGGGCLNVPVREIRFEGVETLERSDAELIQFLEYRGLGPSLSVPLGALYHKSIDAADLQAIAEELGRPPSFSERRRRRIMAGAVAGIARSPGKAYKPGRHSPRKRF